MNALIRRKMTKCSDRTVAQILGPLLSVKLDPLFLRTPLSTFTCLANEEKCLFHFVQTV